MTTTEIYNYRKVSENLITGGLPTSEQLGAAAEEGFTTVINLAGFDPHYSLKDEDHLVQSLGMDYHHIPVDWENPTRANFDAFEALLLSLPEQKTLIHCAANFRVTAFYSLFARKHLGWTKEAGEALRQSVWQGSSYPVWENFIEDVAADFLQAS
jgi:protein tyrosine phosphatase (PTP) superfamily phosphohydrolase (DUF442 family)